MRGRKRVEAPLLAERIGFIKKESPNEGTETDFSGCSVLLAPIIKKESPNEGTETNPVCRRDESSYAGIKKESPNEGTET